MNSNWNTRSFGNIIKKRLYKSLEEICSDDQLLIVQGNILPFLNSLLKFSELTENTNVKKIVIIKDNIETDIADILTTSPNLQLVFLIDVRLELMLPSDFKKFLKTSNLPTVNIVFVAWETQSSTNLLSIEVSEEVRIHHFIETQVLEASPIATVKLSPWEILPIPHIDDNLLICDILSNCQQESLYYPKIQSMEKATRNILIDNMVNAIHSLLKNTNTNITHSVAFGEMSKQTVTILKQRVESSRSSEDIFIIDTLHANKNSTIETDLIVFERSIDPLTPFLTQLTYAGIIDDLYELDSNGKIKSKDLKLDHIKDSTWQNFKFSNFGILGPTLNKLARNLQAQYDSRHEAESVGEIKKFVDSLGSLQEEQKYLKEHTNLSSEILTDVETNDEINFKKLLDLEQDILLNDMTQSTSCAAIVELIYENIVDRKHILRLLCIISLCYGGIKDSDYSMIKGELIDTYGIEICFLLEKLTIAGLFVSKSQLAISKKASQSYGNEFNIKLLWNKDYRTISTLFDTFPDDSNESSNDVSEQILQSKEATYAYCGVVPLYYRLIQLLFDRTTLSKSYSSHQPFMLSRSPNIGRTEELFGQVFGDVNIVEAIIWKPNTKEEAKKVNQRDKKNSHYDISILAFIGGISYSEIAVIKLLQDKLKEKGISKRFIIVTDGITNSEKLLNCMNIEIS